MILNSEMEFSEIPQPRSIEWADAKEIYRHGEMLETVAWFVMGYAATCVAVSYGEGSLSKFASELQAGYSTVTHHRRVYTRLLGLQSAHREVFLRAVKSGALSYTHLLTANAIKDDQEYTEILMEAHDEDWSKRRLAEEVRVKRAEIDAWTPEDPDVPRQESEVIHEEELVTCPVCGVGKVKKGTQ